MAQLSGNKGQEAVVQQNADELDVSYVVVGYRNEVSHLENLANSLYQATAGVVARCEVILVMNDSSCIAPSKGVRVVQGHGNVGFAEGVRRGVKEAQGAYIVIANPDCTIDEDNLRRFVAQRSDRLIVTTPVLKNDYGAIDYMHYENWTFTPGRKVSEKLCRHYVLHSRRPRIPWMVKIPGTFIGLPRRLALELGGPFDNSFFLYGEDRDLTNRLRRLGIPMVLVREVFVQHTGGESGKSVSNLVEKCKSDSSLRIGYRRFGRLGSILVALDLLLIGYIKDKIRGGNLLPARVWAVRRWCVAGLRDPGRLNESLLTSK